MNRLDFIKNCSLACVSGAILSTILESCSTAYHFAKFELAENQLKVLKSEFTFLRKGQPSTRTFVLVRSERLNYPIYLHRKSETEFTAIWMECTHQGTELTAHGEYLSCPSHGAEFDKNGHVTSGPATKELRTFKTTSNETHVSILLA
jgi:Rieske Fe-S protein